MGIQTREELRELRLIQVREFEESGLPAQQWCDENDLRLPTLRYWKARAKQESASASGFVDITAISANDSCTAIIPLAGSGTITVRIKEFSIDVGMRADVATLKNVLSAVRQLC